MAEVDIDVLIVDYLTPELTRQAVAAVSGSNVQIWICDNSGEILAGPPVKNAHVLGDGTNRWYAPGSNLLFARGRAPLVLLLNPDVVMDADALTRLASALEADTDAWGAAPLMVDPHGAVDRTYLRRLPSRRALLADRLPPLRSVFARSYANYVGRDIDPRIATRVEQPAAACLLLRRDRVGARLFDEDYRLFFNDVDLARRLNETGGYCLNVPEVIVCHLGGAGVKRAAARGELVWLEYDEALLRYARKQFGPSLLLVAAMFLGRWARRLRRALSAP